MNSERLAWLLAVAALAVGAWWLSANTEWVEVDRPRAAQGEAADNRVYAFEQLLRRLGMTAEHHESLDPMPPPQARLVLLSNDWELTRGRAEQLHQWVLRGGHLVLMEPSAWDDTALAKWVPVSGVFVKTSEKREPPRPASGPAAAARAAGLTELASTPPLWDATPWVSACQTFETDWVLRAKPGHTVSWTLTRVDGTRATQSVLAKQTQALDALQAKTAKPARPVAANVQVMRVPVGQGSVTVLNTYGRIFDNAQALDCEHPLLLAAAVQAEPGATTWIYVNEKREALLPWLWHRGWIAIVVGGLALAAALWRAAVRFGPRLAPAPRLRRSISEQVRGLAAYLQGGGREALLTAQQRALNEQAVRSLPRFARLSPNERVHAIANATGLAADELATALSTRFCTRAQLPQRLQLLETARRRLQRTPDERLAP